MPLKQQKIYTKQSTMMEKRGLKMKTKGIKKSSGRNNSGKITAFHRGGGHKRRYRLIDFFRHKKSSGIVCSIEYDPNRNSHIAAVYDFNNCRFYYMLAPKNLDVGDIVESGLGAEARLGNSLPLKQVPLGSYVHNLATKKGGGAKIARAAGTFIVIKEKTTAEVLVELKSGVCKIVSSDCFASMGVVSNENVNLRQKYKAGQSRWLNRRPTVRGVAMNPVDHPHGGGEGKKSGLNKTPWGKYNQRGSTGKSNRDSNTLRLKNE
jgi:large subunit ribosomal protein L2